ncbi:MAG TPA: histidinol-phosphate transaminase [Desulfobacteraceae bacterium]|nr:histidinol-phosphate transaminase [Deltaproteobacteria bacterium]MBW2355536.1 histidinol-phosphate transaminase [Deltaproteobacteria bacterium]RLB96279.1 MAG: histidinol-phosphate transaminase [Deltaproteobacteria bacterium]HDI61242.1 histidinol-phosphate transaminase [Desulfobacteraceae bacterium]
MFTQRFRQLAPYVPGEQPRDRQYLKLNTNECPYPPAPQIADLLRRFDPSRLRLYPDPTMMRLREAIAARHGLSPEQVFTGNGSDEVLSFCFYAFFGADLGTLRLPAFTYSFYPVYCDFYGIPYEKVPLTEAFEVDLDALCATGTAASGIIFANPNAPTGHFWPPERIAAMLKRFRSDRVVVVDEAYVDFGGESVLPLLDAHPNLLIARTLSKSLALAGLRIGYALGHPALIQALFAVKDGFNSYPLDTLAQEIGALAIAEEAYYRNIAARIAATRTRFAAALGQLGWQVLPSRANFVFARRPGIAGQTVYQTLKAEGILVRHFNPPEISDFVRITIGTDPQMDRLLAVVSRLWP